MKYADKADGPMLVTNGIAGSRRVVGFIVCATLMFMNVALHGRAYGHGDTYEKLQRLTQDISDHPQSADLHRQRGQVHAQHGHWDEAIADYERAEQLDPEIKHLDLLLGKALRKAKRFEEAVSRLDRYIIKYSESPGAYLARARAHASALSVDAASADFAKVAKLAPNPDACVEWATLLVKTNRAAEAIQRLEEGCNALGPLISLQVKIIDIENSRGNYDAALKRIDAILVNAPRKESGLARKGDVLARAGKPSAAADAYMQALVALRRLPSRHRNSAAMQTLQKSLQQKLGEKKNRTNVQ